MRLSIIVVMLVALTACGKTGAPDSVDFLVAHPARLRHVEQQCANDYARMGAAECNAASEARRRLFIGNGKPAYTPSKDPPKF